ncbi:MAG TPA: hypothetical protein VK742_21360 [Candidatus Sulfotelmatobacter sp.]|nr:hypothetical protein [Candidatus Sulfotelmatobacter sp.]
MFAALMTLTLNQSAKPVPWQIIVGFHHFAADGGITAGIARKVGSRMHPIGFTGLQVASLKSARIEPENRSWPCISAHC